MSGCVPQHTSKFPIYPVLFACHEAARIDNTVDVDNDEQDRPVEVCAGRGPRYG